MCVIILTALKSFLCLPLAHWCSNPKTGVHSAEQLACTSERLAMAKRFLSSVGNLPRMPLNLGSFYSLKQLLCLFGDLATSLVARLAT